jgi:hypothetical protein
MIEVAAFVTWSIMLGWYAYQVGHRNGHARGVRDAAQLAYSAPRRDREI